MLVRNRRSETRNPLPIGEPFRWMTLRDATRRGPGEIQEGDADEVDGLSLDALRGQSDIAGKPQGLRGTPFRQGPRLIFRDLADGPQAVDLPFFIGLRAEEVPALVGFLDPLALLYGPLRANRARAAVAIRSGTGGVDMAGISQSGKGTET